MGCNAASISSCSYCDIICYRRITLSRIFICTSLVGEQGRSKYILFKRNLLRFKITFISCCFIIKRKIKQEYLSVNCDYSTGRGICISVMTVRMQVRRCCMSVLFKLPIFPILKQGASVTFPGQITWSANILGFLEKYFFQSVGVTLQK